MLYDFFLKNLFIFVIIICILAFLIFYEFFYSRKFKNAIQVIDILKYVNHDRAVIFDLRSDIEYKKCHILDSINLPIDKLYSSSFLIKKYKNRKIILIFNSNKESIKVIKHFKLFINYDVFYLDGGFNSWLKENMPTTTL
ncbi:MAG TPA: rhodanese-like domain-containing protein [Candidatus Azoamicus sp. MARI]